MESAGSEPIGRATSSPSPLPLIILAGSDRKASVLPEEGRGKIPLVGYKGVDVRVGGRLLIEEVVERLRLLDRGRITPDQIREAARVWAEASKKGRAS